MTDHSEPRLYLDELHRLRVAKDHRAVDDLAEQIWETWLRGGVSEPLGLAAVCQVAFVSSLDAVADIQSGRGSSDDESAAARSRLWYARALTASASMDEANTVAMLMLMPMFQALDLGHHETALLIMDEIERVIDEHEHRLQAEAHADRRHPGVGLDMLRRVQHEKRGFILWRMERYVEALDQYRRAVTFTVDSTRDRTRCEIGIVLASIGMGLTGDAEPATHRWIEELAHLAERAEGNGWNDVAVPIRENIELMTVGITDAQQLTPIELE